MDERSATGVIRSAVAALNDGDVDGYLTHFEPSCLRWIDGFAEPLGLSEVAASLRQLHTAFEGLRLHEELLFGDHRFACARWRLQGVHMSDFLGLEASGNPVDVATCEVYEVADGRVTTSWVYGQLEELPRQISMSAGTGRATT